MKADTTRRIIIWTSVAAILGVGGYFAYTKLIKPYLDKRKQGNTPTPTTDSTPTPAPATTTSSTTSSTSSDKSKTREQMRGEAISRGEHAFKWWDYYMGKWRYLDNRWGAIYY